MKSLKNFDRSEWLRLAPLEAAMKQVRNDLWLWAYERAGVPGLDRFLDELKQESQGRPLLFVIAFEQPWALDWLLRNAKKHVQDAIVVVCDNSRSVDARAAIKAVCRERGAPYLALPYNVTRHVNRSHGLAMCWVYRNVALPLAPGVFGFIDHDLIPIRDIHIANRLGDQPFFGLPVHSRWAYQLWAGYCLFSHEGVKQRSLNFLYDFSIGLDTGGRNWSRLYRYFDPATLRFAGHQFRSIADPVSGEPASVQIVDDSWLHIGGISYNDGFRPKAQLFERLANALALDPNALERGGDGIESAAAQAPERLPGR